MVAFFPGLYNGTLTYKWFKIQAIEREICYFEIRATGLTDRQAAYHPKIYSTSCALIHECMRVHVTKGTIKVKKHKSFARVLCFFTFIIPYHISFYNQSTDFQGKYYLCACNCKWVFFYFANILSFCWKIPIFFRLTIELCEAWFLVALAWFSTCLICYGRRFYCQYLLCWRFAINLINLFVFYLFFINIFNLFLYFENWIGLMAYQLISVRKIVLEMSFTEAIQHCLRFLAAIRPRLKYLLSLENLILFI